MSLSKILYLLVITVSHMKIGKRIENDFSEIVTR